MDPREVWMLWSRGKSLNPVENLTPDFLPNSNLFSWASEVPDELFAILFRNRQVTGSNLGVQANYPD
jgi:hypothetical protein